MRAWIPGRRTDPDAAALGEQLADLRERIRDIEQAGQAEFRSVDDGAIDIYDDDDNLRARLGKQPDGSFTVKAFGKKPNVPTEPDVIPVPGGCIVEWDGSYEDGQAEDIHRIAVHLGTTANFAIVTDDDEDDSDEDSTERAAIMSPRGGGVFLALDPGNEKYWVRLTAVAEGGIESDPSDAVEVIVAEPEGAYHQDEFVLTAAGAQDLKLTFEPIDNSEHLYWNGLYQREDVTWTRIRKTVSLTGAPYPAKVGDLVVVEYAYLPGEQPEEITYYRGTPKRAAFRNELNPVAGYGNTFIWTIEFEEPVLDLLGPQLSVSTGDLPYASLRLRFYSRRPDGSIWVSMLAYTSTGGAQTIWAEGPGRAHDPHIYSVWQPSQTLPSSDTLYGVQVYPFTSDDSNRPAMGYTDARNGFFWLGPQVDGQPAPWAPLT